jgi:hypothetical protein
LSFNVDVVIDAVIDSLLVALALVAGRGER